MPAFCYHISENSFRICVWHVVMIVLSQDVSSSFILTNQNDRATSQACLMYRDASNFNIWWASELIQIWFPDQCELWLLICGKSHVIIIRWFNSMETNFTTRAEHKRVKREVEQDCEGTECSGGCCPQANYFCCTDGQFCAPSADFCP